MRKYYLDNVKWVTVVTVVVYHVIYMYNAEGLQGVLGKVTGLDVQYYDVYQYAVYPWFMTCLFMVSGVTARLYLERHTHREFIAARTTKLLVPSTVGLFAFQFLQGFVNASFGTVLDDPALPFFAKALISVVSGIGVLWYVQLLWVYSLLLVAIRRLEGERLWCLGGRAGLPFFAAFALPVYGAAQVLNTPIVPVYRVGLYFCVFLLGYFVLSHESAVAVLKRWFPLFLGAALALGTAFCLRYFGENYAVAPVNRSVLYVLYGYFGSLAMIGGMARYGDRANRFTAWMSQRSFGLYVFHYLGVSSVALFLGKPGYLPAPALYFLSLIAGFGGGFLLYELISRIPGYRWAVLGIKEKKHVQG